MLTSKEIIEKTGISRATLHNYVSTGLVAKPDVLPPQADDGDAPRIGYFPDDTVERIEAIQRMKREGWSISRIAEHFARGGASAPPLPAPASSSAPSVAAVPVRLPGAPLDRAAPRITSVATLVTTLQDAPRLWIRLLANEYFELVNEVWTELDPVYRRHGGTAGRHPDEGLVSYFFPQPRGSYLWDALSAAEEARTAMRALSRRWQERKGWDVQLFMNTGIDDGRDWVGAAGASDLRVLGDAAERAGVLSRYSRDGALLVTRSLIEKLSPAEISRVSFGTSGRLPGFGRLQDIAGTQPVPPWLADLAVAEIFEIRPLAGATTAIGAPTQNE